MTENPSLKDRDSRNPFQKSQNTLQMMQNASSSDGTFDEENQMVLEQSFRLCKLEQKPVIQDYVLVRYPTEDFYGSMQEKPLSGKMKMVILKLFFLSRL